ncbi:hypothetical protein QFC21_006737 [Naganishia friedmannii]|uniref:Uncharacterized protein n=1 Tax=Naganishia friedmannii TaxID=89922 RepID=A0ACC2V236_9TREE|nr:hypothetical protein QFC21_006737 [Naganishia friedmannii]
MKASRTIRAALATSTAMPAHLVPEARSTYRALLRASSITFAGDKPNQSQFRSIIRATFASPTLSSPLAKNTPPPPPPVEKPQTPCESYAASLDDRSSSSLEEKDVQQMSEAEYQERLKHWREVAAILRQNVVQGRKIEKKESREQVVENKEQAEGATGEDGTVWKLRITPDTELGDNTTIRAPPKLPTTPFPNRERRRRRHQQQEQTKSE